MTNYVAGFMFSPSGQDVLLLRKTHPPWQANLLNGVGGHIEPKENPYDAMIREFEEETGIKTFVSDWVLCVRLHGPDWLVYFFRSTADIDAAVKITSETPIVVSVKHINEAPVIRNLLWLIPLLRDTLIKYPIDISAIGEHCGGVA